MKVHETYYYGNGHICSFRVCWHTSSVPGNYWIYYAYTHLCLYTQYNNSVDSSYIIIIIIILFAESRL